MAAGADINVKVLPGETNANIQAYLHGDFQAGLVIWSGRADPDFNIAQYLSCDGFQDWGKYCDRTFEALLHQARATTDQQKRYDLYHQVAAVYLKDEPMVFLVHMSWLYAMTNRLSDFSTVPNGLIRPQGLTLQ
ncbi:MAG: hypothetical protein ACREFQ_12025 [Stellaceae bacterium]